MIKILPVIISILLLYKAELLPEKEYNKDYLSVKTTTILKGYLAFFVFFQHIQGYSQGSSLFLIPFQKYGYLAVGAFFFLSAYGLCFQYLNKENYQKSFISKRINRIVVPYFIVSLIYLFYFNLTGHNYNLLTIIQRILSGDPLATYTWFICEIIIIYFLFYISITLIKDKKTAIYFACVLIIFLKYLLKIKIGESTNLVWWYESTHMFAIGLLYCYYENKILHFIYRLYSVLLSLCLMLFAISLFNYLPIDISEIIFVLLIILFSLKIKINSRVMEFMGKISLYFYMFQGLSIRIVRRFIYFDSLFVMFSLMIILDIVMAFVFQKIYDYIINRIFHSVKS
ncbi:MAG: acyltransferase family protein [Erysipelotrichaceae bacterium]|nr:acyltransferase family protein [Erysipelotrichaceae bacterium]